MKTDQTRPLQKDDAKRREWVRPAISRLNAGSAENDVGPNNDLSVNIS